MKNRSAEYIRHRPAAFELRKAKEQDEVEIFFTKIAHELGKLRGLVEDVEKECARYCIPSFASKALIAKRIDELQYTIGLNLARAKGLMERFSARYEKAINHALVTSIAVHFHYTLDSLVARMGESLQKIEGAKDALEDSSASPFAQEERVSAEGVHKSVHFISSVIRELKSVVTSQSEKIERLDSAMDAIAHSAEKSNKEIASISNFGSQTKNRIITVLFFSILVLIGLSTVKVYTHRR